jgi:hypothetical protein
MVDEVGGAAKDAPFEALAVGRGQFESGDPCRSVEDGLGEFDEGQVDDDHGEEDQEEAPRQRLESEQVREARVGQDGADERGADGHEQHRPAGRMT